MYWKINFVNRKLRLLMAMFLCCSLFVANSKAQESGCANLLYHDFVHGSFDHKLDSAMNTMFHLYKQGEYVEIENKFAIYSGSAIWVLQHFVGAVNYKLGKKNPFVYLNSRYGEKDYSAYSAIINALTLSYGLIYQDYAEDLAPNEILLKWINDESPDHIKYASQIRSSNQFGGYRRGIEDLNYGSSLAHLLFIRDYLKIEMADKYVAQVENAINQLGLTNSAKLHKKAELVLNLLVECNRSK